MEFEIGFLGYGAMARAISQGLAENGNIAFDRQIASGRDRSKLDQAALEKGLTVADNNQDLARRCQTVVLGVKPAQIVGVMKEIRDQFQGGLVISLAAGVNLETMGPHVPPQAGLVRSMPNVAALAGGGTTLICAPPETDETQIEKARDIFESVGLCLNLPEHLFDAAGAVSGSGPAYFFEIMENLVRGAVRLGLPWAEARRLVINTALGSALMAQKMETSALADLRDMVTSPGGTTAEALYVFERGGLGGLMQKALEAAAKKSRKLL